MVHKSSDGSVHAMLATSNVCMSHKSNASMLIAEDRKRLALHGGHASVSAETLYFGLSTSQHQRFLVKSFSFRLCNRRWCSAPMLLMQDFGRE